MSHRTDYPLERFLTDDNAAYGIDLLLFNKVVVFLYRVYDILSLLHQWKLSSGEQRTALDAKFQEPMDPTGKWFTGTIYEAMESPLDNGLKVDRISVDLFSEDEGWSIFSFKKEVNAQSITKWGHLVRELSTLTEGKVSLKHLLGLTKGYEILSSEYNEEEPIDAVATYGGLINLYAKPMYMEDFNEGVAGAIEFGSWDIGYVAQNTPEEESDEDYFS